MRVSLTSVFVLAWCLTTCFACSGSIDSPISDPCDPNYTGADICPTLDVDAGIAFDSGQPAQDQVIDGGQDGQDGQNGQDDSGVDAGEAGEVDSGSCQCWESDVCCDGCNPIGEGQVCHDDDLACTEHRCNGAGSCEMEVLQGWCLVDGTCHDTLIDSSHCGACDHGCNPEEVCVDGACEPQCDLELTWCDGVVCLCWMTEKTVVSVVRLVAASPCAWMVSV